MKNPLKSKPVIGWIFYDFANSAFATTVLAVIFNQYFSEVIAGGEKGTDFSILGTSFKLPGAVIWNYLVAFSTILVALSSPLLGAIADYTRVRKILLAAYCYLGVFATILLAFSGPENLLFACLLFIIANFGFAGGNVFYNTFLLDVSPKKYFGRISGIAWGLGYLGGGLCLVLNLIMLKYPQIIGFEKDYFTVRHCIIVAGVWWGLFAIPTMVWIKEPGVRKQYKNLITLTKIGVNRLKDTFVEIKKYRQLSKFLLSYLLFNDGIETIIIMASIFGATVIGLNPGELVMFFILIQASGFAGALSFGWIADWIGNKKTLMITLIIWLLVVLWAYKIGFLVNLRVDFFLMGILAGLVMGGSQTVARSMQAFFTPSHKSAEFFGFFAISGRFASAFGPIIYGTTILLTSSLQKGILVLGLFFIAGGAVLFFVDEHSHEEVV